MYCCRRQVLNLWLLLIICIHVQLDPFHGLNNTFVKYLPLYCSSIYSAGRCWVSHLSLIVHWGSSSHYNHSHKCVSFGSSTGMVLTMAVFISWWWVRSITSPRDLSNTFFWSTIWKLSTGPKHHGWFSQDIGTYLYRVLLSWLRGAILNAPMHMYTAEVDWAYCVTGTSYN